MNVKKLKILGLIIMNKLEIKKFTENLDFPVNGSTEKKIETIGILTTLSNVYDGVFLNN